MFNVRTRPLHLAARRLQGLRLSLNTPVVATLELPAAPARAAILVHQEDGARRITVALRSLPAGESVLYELEGEDLDDDSAFEVGFDGALTFAESMGFLFDDEVIVDRGAEALRRALASIEEILPGATGDEPAPAARAEEGAEILLDDALESDATAARPAAVALTKFRAAGAVPPAAGRPASARRAARLGRVRPVRLRVADGASAPDPLIRLLSAF